MTDKNIKATVNAIQNTLKSNGISMSFLDLDTLPVETRVITGLYVLGVEFAP